MREGKYTNVFDNAWTYHPTNMKYSDLKRIYNDFSEKSADYDIVWRNCKHWAKEVYNKIKFIY